MSFPVGIPQRIILHFVFNISYFHLCHTFYSLRPAIDSFSFFIITCSVRHLFALHQWRRPSPPPYGPLTLALYSNTIYGQCGTGYARFPLHATAVSLIWICYGFLGHRLDFKGIIYQMEFFRVFSVHFCRSLTDLFFWTHNLGFGLGFTQ